MARGNLPGVSLARRLLKVGVHGAGRGHAGEADSARAGALPSPRPARPAVCGAPPPGSTPASTCWRYLRAVTPGRLRAREVVVADRWIYDLRESPWPGSRAARLAEFLLPAPDVLVLPDAPVDLIHRRKPERLLDEQREQQERFRRLLAERPARHAEMVVDTSGRTADPLAEVVAAVIEAAHASAPSRDRSASASWRRADVIA